MAQTLWTTRLSNLVADRELAILRQLTSDGIISGVAPYVDAADTGWTLSLSSGSYFCDGTYIQESAGQTSLWTGLNAYGAGGTNPGGGMHFLFYAEYEFDQSLPVGPNYRFLHADYNTSLDLSDRGDASKDPNHADTPHINAPAVELARVYVDDTATAITHADVRIYRSDILRSRSEIEAIASREIWLSPFTARFSITGGSENLLEWDSMSIKGFNHRVQSSKEETDRIADIDIEGAASGGSYAWELEFDRSDAINGGIIFIRPDWDNPTTALQLQYATLNEIYQTSEHSSKNDTLMGNDNGYTGNDVYPYRPDFENIIVLGYVLGNVGTTIVWRNGQVHQLKGGVNAVVSTFGTTSNYTQSLSATSYPAAGTVYPDDAGDIDLDNVILNLADLADLTLDDVYDSTAVASNPGDGREITVDGGAVHLKHVIGEGADPYNEKWLTPLSSRIGDASLADKTYEEDFEAGVDVYSESVERAARTGAYDDFYSWSDRVALRFRYPLYYDNGVDTIDFPQSINLSRNGTPPNEFVVVTDPGPDIATWQAALGVDTEVHVTFALTDGTQIANDKTYIMYFDGGEMRIKDTDGTDQGLASEFDSAGELATPINSQDMTAWIIPVEIKRRSRFLDIVCQRNVEVGLGLWTDTIFAADGSAVGESITLNDGVDIDGAAGDNFFTTAGIFTIKSSAEKVVLLTSDVTKDIELDAGRDILIVGDNIKGAGDLTLLAGRDGAGDLTLDATFDAASSIAMNFTSQLTATGANYQFNYTGFFDVLGAGTITLQGNTDVTGTFSVSSTSTFTDAITALDNIVVDGQIKVDEIAEKDGGNDIHILSNLDLQGNDITNFGIINGSSSEGRFGIFKTNTWDPLSGVDVLINASGDTTIAGTAKVNQIEQKSSGDTMVIGRSDSTIEFRGTITRFDNLYVSAQIDVIGGPDYQTNYSGGYGSITDPLRNGAGDCHVLLGDNLTNGAKVFVEIQDDGTLGATEIWTHEVEWVSSARVDVRTYKVDVNAGTKTAFDIGFWIRIFENA